MRLSQAISVAASLALGFLGAFSSARAGEDPKDFVSSIYGQYVGKDSNGVDIGSPDQISRYFDGKLSELFERDRREHEGEVGRLDGDPFLGAQDWEVTMVEVQVDEADADHAKCTANLTNGGQPYPVHLDLVKSGDGWRISDVRWPGQEESLRELLGKDGT